MIQRPHAIAMPVLLVAAMLALSAHASAVYTITPLRLQASANEGEVGDEIAFDLSANPDHEGPSYAGQTVTARYSYDPHEGEHQASEDPEAPVSNESSGEESDSPYVHADITQVALDEKSSGAFVWTIPAEVDDRNVFIVILSADNETLASSHVRVGDAEPMMFTMQEGAPGSPEPVTGDAEPADGSGETLTPSPSPTPTPEESEGNDTPALGLVATLAAVAAGAAGLAHARRRR